MDKREGELIKYTGKILRSKHPNIPDHYYVKWKSPYWDESNEACAGWSTNVMLDSLDYSHSGLECHAWGYDGLGPQLLACNILAFYTDCTTGSDQARARKYYKQFTTEVIAHLPDEWELTGEEVARWVEKQEQQTKGKDNEPGETEKAAGPDQ